MENLFIFLLKNRAPIDEGDKKMVVIDQVLCSVQVTQGIVLLKIFELEHCNCRWPCS